MPDPNAGYKLDAQSLRRLQRQLTRNENTPYDVTGDDAVQVGSGTPVNWQLGGNAAGQTIPPYSCVAVGPVNQAGPVYACSLGQPAAPPGIQYGLTGIKPAAYGVLCSFHLEAGWATYDSSAVPQPGDVWGPLAGQWSLTKGLPGFTVVQIVDASRQIMLVVPDGPLAQIVSPYAGSGAALYDPVSQSANCLYPGQVYNVVQPADGASNFFCTNKPLSSASGQNCWLWVENGIISPGATKPLHHGDRYAGVLVAPAWTIGGSTWPVYAVREDDPHEWVTPYDSGSSALGKPIAVNAGGFVPGQALKWSQTAIDYTTAGFANAYSCWIWVADNPGGNDTAGLTLPFGDQFLGRYLGVATVSGSTRVVYSIRRESPGSVLVQLYSTVTGRSGTALGSGSGYLCTLSGNTITVSTTLLTVYNSNVGAIARFLPDGVTTKYVQCKYVSGQLLVDTDDCFSA